MATWLLRFWVFNRPYAQIAYMSRFHLQQLRSVFHQEILASRRALYAVQS